MRLIVEVKLKNGTLMSIIANVQNKEEARSWAAKYSNRLFGDSNMFVYKDSPITAVEKWSQERAISCQHGNKQYIVAFFMNNVTQLIKIEAAGVKSAYNIVKIKYGIQDNINMMIYDKHQNIKKKSAVAVSKELMSNNSKLNAILVKAHDKMKTFPVLGKYAADIPLFIGIIKDYCNGNYKAVPLGTIIGMLECLIYFLSPIDLIPDIIPGLGQLDDIAVLVWAINQCHDDLVNYSKWLSNNEGEEIIVVGF